MDPVTRLRTSGLSSTDLVDSLTALGLDGFIGGVHSQSPPVSAFFSGSLGPQFLDASGKSKFPVVGRAFPVVFESADSEKPADPKHYVDSIPAVSDCVAVIQAPRDGSCAANVNAVWGGLMSTRAKSLGAAGVVIDGMCRDLQEHWEQGFPVFARSHGCCGQGAFKHLGAGLKCVSIGEKCVVGDWAVEVKSGDLIVADVDGVVRVPLSEVDRVVEKGVALKEVDSLCMQDIKGGRPVKETFKDRRGK
uniref:RraA-like protein n=1 Tax=Chromera velia CCMP2878 TaxID=1169474 RepID=A0A0G4I8I5_9ALVE|mmetsp:Transcript_53997/g.105594  ORF Transcript_53997/g.105594 Transcript_53997/m.105594 type:complete len:248 (+) Transcript_53997:205-948(+)|eukprot:Cvel_11973.t1-p1 / transcript=Cvel_11973.t1 / gene=Cvel_11973 / organism=Chromera_velia_CCMP2878 / gene_product=Uncharacterized protein YER010C, putative / transcript_product=Uncharacterized protein YER010C, putative / location=Cvel_scaffold767:60334-61732(+) / protein_length=247 / sequence_SO=supercontig / SO=protein_coding / is_pseudo=false